MNRLPPVTMQYLGAGEFRTSARMGALCDNRLVVGEEYRFENIEDRSTASHAHYFACIQTAWENLPTALAERFTNPEALRKYALIRAGHCDSDSFVASSKAEALRLAAFLRSGEEFTVITVSGATVTRYRARSQSMRAQGKSEFQRVKDAVLQILAELLGTDPVTLGKSEAA